MSLKIDPKSPIPKNEQISRQITRFTNNQNRYLREKISTDHFKELIEIEQEFGSIVFDPTLNQQQIIQKQKEEAAKKDQPE